MSACPPPVGCRAQSAVCSHLTGLLSVRTNGPAVQLQGIERPTKQKDIEGRRRQSAAAFSHLRKPWGAPDLGAQHSQLGGAIGLQKLRQVSLILLLARAACSHVHYTCGSARFRLICVVVSYGSFPYCSRQPYPLTSLDLVGCLTMLPGTAWRPLQRWCQEPSIRLRTLLTSGVRLPPSPMHACNSFLPLVALAGVAGAAAALAFFWLLVTGAVAAWRLAPTCIF